MRDSFIKVLSEEAEKNENIVLLTGDLGFSLFEKFQEKFPDRFYNMGIAEQNMVGVAAGLALQGKKVFVYSIIPFVTYRCLEQIRNDLCYQELGVVIVGVGSGLSYGASGFSHHAIDDIGCLRSVPNLTILSPSDPVEVGELVKQSIDYPHPVYLRLGKAKEPVFTKDSSKIKIGKINPIRLGSKLAILVHGNIIDEVHSSLDILKKQEVNPSLISVHTIKPLGEEEIRGVLKDHSHIIIVEKHSYIGGLGDSVFNLNKNNENSNKFLHICLDDSFVHEVGGSKHLRSHTQMDSKSIARRILRFVGGEEN